MQKKIISFLSILLISLQVYAPNEFRSFKKKMDQLNADPRVVRECFLFIKTEIKIRKKNLETNDLQNLALHEPLLKNPETLEAIINALNTSTTDYVSQKNILNVIMYNPRWQRLIR